LYFDQAYELLQRPPADFRDGCDAAVTDAGGVSNNAAPQIDTVTNNFSMRSTMIASILNIARIALLSSTRVVPALCLTSLFAAALCATEPPGSAESEPVDSLVEKSREQLKQMLPEGFMDSTDSIIEGRSATERKSPTGALLRSMALPGWGQFYTGHPVRGTITAVAETAFLAGMVLKFRDRADLRNELSRLEADNGPDWPVDDPERVRLNSRIKSAQHSGGDYLAYGVTALLMGMLDSYVSAHLYNFGRHFAVSESGRGQLAIRICF
jgi:hypothetical protein